jgi:hypothetical protein
VLDRLAGLDKALAAAAAKTRASGGGGGGGGGGGARRERNGRRWEGALCAPGRPVCEND